MTVQGIGSYRCPLCGDIPTMHQHLSDRLRALRGGVGVPAVAGGDAAINLDPNVRPENYFYSNGCKMLYVDVSSFDINIILDNLRIDPLVEDPFRHYYGSRVTVEELIKNHRTGIIRKPRNMLSFLTDRIFKSKLYVGFNFEGKRTFGTFVKIKKDEIENYLMTAIGVP